MLYDDFAGSYYSINQTKYVKDMSIKVLPKHSVAVKTSMRDITLCNDICVSILDCNDEGFFFSKIYLA